MIDNLGLLSTYLTKVFGLIICRIKATNFQVIMSNDDQVEVSFSRQWDPSLKGKLVPLNIDKRSFLHS